MSRAPGTWYMILLLFGMVLMPKPLSAQGNGAAVQVCQHGGWAELQGEDGETFTSQGECVRYAAQGGVVSEISGEPTIQVSFSSTTDPNRCDFHVQLEDFAPNTAYTVDRYSWADDGRGVLFELSQTVTTSAGGDVEFLFGSFPKESASIPTYLSARVGDVSSSFELILC